MTNKENKKIIKNDYNLPIRNIDFRKAGYSEYIVDRVITDFLNSLYELVINIYHITENQKEWKEFFEKYHIRYKIVK